MSWVHKLFTTLKLFFDVSNDIDTDLRTLTWEMVLSCLACFQQPEIPWQRRPTFKSAKTYYKEIQNQCNMHRLCMFSIIKKYLKSLKDITVYRSISMFCLLLKVRLECHIGCGWKVSLCTEFFIFCESHGRKRKSGKERKQTEKKRNGRRTGTWIGIIKTLK